MANPLLQRKGLPRFHEIKPEHIEPAINEVIKETQAAIESLEANLTPSWEGLLEPLESLDIPFEYSWGPVNHLLGVQNSDALREAHTTVLPKVVDLSLRIKQSPAIYEGLKAIRESDGWQDLDAGQQRVINLKLRAAKHAGVGLEGEAKERFNEIARELSQLSTDFSNHVLDATKAFGLVITDASLTKGWTATLKMVAAQMHAQATESEPDPENGPGASRSITPALAPSCSTIATAISVRRRTGPSSHVPHRGNWTMPRLLSAS